MVDMLMVEKVGVGTFKQKLKQLEDAGLIGAAQVDVLDAALDAASAAAHRGHAPNDSEVNVVMVGYFVHSELENAHIDCSQSLKCLSVPSVDGVACCKRLGIVF